MMSHSPVPSESAAETVSSADSDGLSDISLPTPRRKRWARPLLLILAILLPSIGYWAWRHLHHPRRAWNRAKAALNRYDLKSAAAHLDEYLQQRPEDASAWFLAGRTARRLSRFNQAEKYLIRCQELGGITEATRLEWDLLQIQQGRLGDLHLRLRQTIPPDHPDSWIVLEALIQGYLRTGRLLDVLEACDLWIGLHPEHPWPWRWRGEVFEQLQNYSRALKDYQKALDRAPENPEILLALGNLCLKASKPNAAIGHFQRLLQQTPDNTDALLGIAACKLEKGQAEEALPYLRPVLESTSVPAEALLLRAKVAMDSDKPLEAEPWLRKVLNQAPDQAEALHVLIQCLTAQGKVEEADRLRPKLEQLRRDLKRYNDLIREIARKPDRSDLRHEMGVICLRLGRDQEALVWLNSALKAKGDHTKVHEALANYYEKKGDQARAASHRSLATMP